MISYNLLCFELKQKTKCRKLLSARGIPSKMAATGIRTHVRVIRLLCFIYQIMMYCNIIIDVNFAALAEHRVLNDKSHDDVISIISGRGTVSPASDSEDQESYVNTSDEDTSSRFSEEEEEGVR